MKKLTFVITPNSTELEPIAKAVNEIHGRIEKLDVTPISPFFDSYMNAWGYSDLLVTIFVTPDASYKAVHISLTDSGEPLTDGTLYGDDESDDYVLTGCVSYCRGRYCGQIITTYIDSTD